MSPPDNAGMPVDISKLRPYRTSISNNGRWANFEPRAGDIVVCTPAKCGTTWTQTIVHSLLWPDGDAPGGVMELAPWIEFELFPIDDVLARLAGQKHRRAMKSHSPADELPVFPDTQYVIVARDGRDAFMSMCNHMERFKALDHLNARASADGLAPMPGWSGDVHGYFLRWLEQGGHFNHLASWWKRRREPNVYLLHYNDLKADLAGEMRKLADWLGLSVREDQWPAAVERCTFEAMRERGSDIGPFELAFEGGSKGFLFQGTNGRWRDVLTREELALYERRVAELTSPELAAWIERGRAALA